MSKIQKRKKFEWHLEDVPLAVPPIETWARGWEKKGFDCRTQYMQGLLNNPARKRASSFPISTKLDPIFYVVSCWCRSRKIDASVWCRWQGIRVRSNSNWRARLDSLFCEDRLKEFRNDEFVGLLMQEMAVSKTTIQSGFVEGRDLSYSGELAKYNFVLRNDLFGCMHFQDLTFGYLGQSKYCRVCSRAEECKARTEERLRSLERAKDGKDR